MNPFLVRLKAEEVPVVQKLLRNETGLNLFLFEIKFLGIIIEKIVIPVFISDEFDLLPSLSKFISRPHNFKDIISENKNNDHTNQDFNLSEDLLKKCYDISIKSTKNWIQKRTQELTILNRDSYFQQRKRMIKSAEQRKNFSEVQLQKTDQKLRAKKLKIPTERQIENLEKITDSYRKKKRMDLFNKIQKEVQYLEKERERWERNLEDLEFDLPEQLKRLKKYKQLLINAECISYARIILK